MVQLVGSSRDRRTAGNHAGEWLVNVAGDQVVPMTTLEVIDALRVERLSDQSLVWRIGMHDWTRIVDVPQLRLVAGTRTQPPPAMRPAQPSLSAPTPVASVLPLPLSPKPRSTIPNSLAPTTAEANDAADRARGPGAWADLNELLDSERRADQRNSRRAVLGAALVSAALAAAFALWLLRAPVPRGREEFARPVQASEAPALAPTLEARVAPSASVDDAHALAAPQAPSPKKLAPSFVKRAKSAPSAAGSAPIEAKPARVSVAASAPAAVPSPRAEGTAPLVTPAPPAPDGQ